MEMTLEAAGILEQAVSHARAAGYEYVTPESVLLAMCGNDRFGICYENCGGDIAALVKDLTGYLESYIGRYGADAGNEPALSAAAEQMLVFAGRSAASSGRNEIGITHLLHAIWNVPESYAVYYMRRQDVSEAELLQELIGAEEDEADGFFDTDDNEAYGDFDEDEDEDDDEEDEEDDEDEDDEEVEFAGVAGKHRGGNWKTYAPCLNETLQNVNPLIGRENELERTIQILCRKDKNNPLHLGEPGVGKTAITYGLVQRINSGDVPDQLKGAKVFALDLGGILAGTQYRGDFEKRFKRVLNGVSKEERPIIYLDEIHNLSGAGAVGEGSFDAANMIKSHLADGHIRFIGATTFEEYKKYFEKNKSLVRRFQNVEIKEPSHDETVEILKGLKERYEEFHGVKYADGVIEYAVEMSAKHINERFLPDKAIDLMDEAGAYRKLHPDLKENIVDRDTINQVLTKICRVPVESVDADDISSLATLEERLKSRVFGQDEAIVRAVNAIKYSKAGLLEEGKPLASLLFVGPTGVGKTEVARSLAEELGVKLLRIDMSEYGEKHAVAKLIGAPAGYVGYEEGGLLTEAVRKNPSSVLLLDEIEKAHSDIYNVLLQVMDYATLTDNQGRHADFRNVVVIMTSNAGASRLGKTGIGFSSQKQDTRVLEEEIRNTFQPEFRNRLSGIVMFNGMDDDMAVRVVDKKLKELFGQLEKKSIRLDADDKAKELIKKKGTNAEYGAREVDRVIRNEVKPILVDEILFGRLKDGGEAVITTQDENFLLKITGKEKL